MATHMRLRLGLRAVGLLKDFANNVATTRYLTGWRRDSTERRVLLIAYYVELYKHIICMFT
jgi:hypothetical protein